MPKKQNGDIFSQIIYIQKLKTHSLVLFFYVIQLTIQTKMSFKNDKNQCHSAHLDVNI